VNIPAPRQVACFFNQNSGYLGWKDLLEKFIKFVADDWENSRLGL
jgi:glycyl-tRNA synthetase alpha subunit